MEKQMLASTTTLWTRLEDDMIHKGNHLDPYKAVMHSRQMIKQSSQGQNIGKIHFEKLLQKEEKATDGNLLGPLLKNKQNFSHLIFTPNTGVTAQTSVTYSDEEQETPPN